MYKIAGIPPFKSKLIFRDAVCAFTGSLLELTVSYAVFFHWSASWSQDSDTAPDNPFLPVFRSYTWFDPYT